MIYTIKKKLQFLFKKFFYGLFKLLYKEISEFETSNFYQPKTILGQKIRSIGLVAGFNDFKSDICLGEIGFF